MASQTSPDEHLVQTTNSANGDSPVRYITQQSSSYTTGYINTQSTLSASSAETSNRGVASDAALGAALLISLSLSRRDSFTLEKDLYQTFFPSNLNNMSNPAKPATPSNSITNNYCSWLPDPFHTNFLLFPNLAIVSRSPLKTSACPSHPASPQNCLI